jgi:hypothetical protein
VSERSERTIDAALCSRGLPREQRSASHREAGRSREQ